MLPEVFLPQSILVDRTDNRTQQLAKSGGEGLEVLVPRIALNIVVEIPDEVNQAFLLLTRKGVVGGIKIGDKYSIKILEQVVQESPLSSWPLHAANLVLIRENAHIPLLLLAMNL